MEKTINWGIIGCGDVTEVKSGPAFNKVPHSRLVAVMRRHAAKAKDYAARHGVPNWYSNAHDLINDPQVDAIYIATPPLQHEEYAIAAINAGKPVYVEKPMAISTEAAERMQKAATDSGIKLTVAHYRRQQPLFKKVKELIEQKAIGEVRLVNLQLLQPHRSAMIAQTEENWRVNPALSGGGLFYDLAPHQLDLMIYFFGKVQKAQGISYNQGRFYEADDITCGFMQFESSVLFNGLWCFTAPATETRDQCEIIGTKGSISFSIFEHKNVEVVSEDHKESFEFARLQHVQQPMIQEVVSYFLGQSPNPCSGEDGVEVMRLIQSFSPSKG